ncbi:hypothetical protein CTEN210_18431 [Chaetoceros tenuissimus]|uniref:Leucine-rich repeat domain-containing protein n=1 Tax=Chaetoceros tenuissimus TaxID=426638 RepID=A0AAD3HFP9_9STRA|nr:hypothetical protein CTEN210_18431 [Chaetoceros tenuissimus]
MKVTTHEWQKFVPGVRMYKGLKTLFYNGEILWNGKCFGNPLVHDKKERQSWEQIVVLPGVKMISSWTFNRCKSIKRILMTDSVQRIEEAAFSSCTSLVFVKLSMRLEYIGKAAFYDCSSLYSIFIPMSCKEIVPEAFACCSKLLIFNVSSHTMLGISVLHSTDLIERYRNRYEENEVHEWIRNMNAGEMYILHRICASENPSLQAINAVIPAK